MIKKILIDEQGNKYYWSSGDLHTKVGKVTEKDIMKGGKITSHLKKGFIVIDATFADATEKIERGPAVIAKKDIGTILATTGINHESKIVDIGTGSGMLAMHLAHISKNVTSYEKSKEFADIAYKNAERCNVKLTIKNKDIMGGIEEKNVDLITVDLKEPWLILKDIEISLKPGGFCVAYLPHITQVQHFVVEARKMNFFVQKISETQEREWMVDELKARPQNMGLLHTGFLVFLRRI